MLSKVENKYLNMNEMKSIRALIAYTAYHNGMEPKDVVMVLSSRFGLQEISDLPSEEYQNVVEFLVDWRPAHLN